MKSINIKDKNQNKYWSSEKIDYKVNGSPYINIKLKILN